MRLLMLGVIFSNILAAGQAGAYDIAERRMIGFAEDGSKFAFEEFGTQDGAGMPYSNIYVVDTHTDQWVAGTPSRQENNKEGGPSLERIRNKSAENIKELLKTITAQGELMASNPIAEYSADPYKIVFCNCPRGAAKYEIKLEKLPLPATTFSADPSVHEDIKGITRGFRLVLKSGQKTKILHEDRDLPKNRGQALDYRITDVVRYGNVLAVLVMFFEPGWEGSNGRYIAVTTQLSDDWWG